MVIEIIYSVSFIKLNLLYLRKNLYCIGGFFLREKKLILLEFGKLWYVFFGFYSMFLFLLLVKCFIKCKLYLNC